MAPSNPQTLMRAPIRLPIARPGIAAYAHSTSTIGIAVGPEWDTVCLLFCYGKKGEMPGSARDDCGCSCARDGSE